MYSNNTAVKLADLQVSKREKILEVVKFAKYFLNKPLEIHDLLG